MAKKKNIKRMVKKSEASADSLPTPASLGDPEYEKIFLDFLSKKISLADLARAHEVNYKKLYSRYKKENWKAWREEYRKKVVQKTLNRLSNSDSLKLRRLMDGADRLNEYIGRIIEDEEQLYLYVDKDGKETALKKANTSYLMEMAVILDKMTAVTSKLYGILTTSEERKIALEQQKIESRIAQYSKNGDTDEEGGGVILLPAVIDDGEEDPGFGFTGTTSSTGRAGPPSPEGKANEE